MEAADIVRVTPWRLRTAVVHPIPQARDASLAVVCQPGIQVKGLKEFKAIAQPEQDVVVEELKPVVAWQPSWMHRVLVAVSSFAAELAIAPEHVSPFDPAQLDCPVRRGSDTHADARRVEISHSAHPMEMRAVGCQHFGKRSPQMRAVVKQAQDGPTAGVDQPCSEWLELGRQKGQQLVAEHAIE
tara:strand:- start:28 stop:582 length:555 start_codon:yes stop_codon:yes gene_type:complete